MRIKLFVQDRSNAMPHKRGPSACGGGEIRCVGSAEMVVDTAEPLWCLVGGGGGRWRCQFLARWMGSKHGAKAVALPTKEIL
jgi:hypothetical protein